MFRVFQTQSKKELTSVTTFLLLFLVSMQLVSL